jgi:hypothetical protein
MAALIQSPVFDDINTYEDSEGWPLGSLIVTSPLEKLAKRFPTGPEQKLSQNIMSRVAILNGNRRFDQRLSAAAAAEGIDPNSDDPAQKERYNELCSEILYNPQTYVGLAHPVSDQETYSAFSREAVTLWAASRHGAKIPSELYAYPYYYVPNPESPDYARCFFKEWLYSGPILENMIAEALFGVALIRDPETSPEEREKQKAIVIRNIGYFAYLEIEALKKDRILEYAPLHAPAGYPVSPFIYRNLGSPHNGPPSYTEDDLRSICSTEGRAKIDRTRSFENLAALYLGPESDGNGNEKLAELVIGIFFEGMMVHRLDDHRLGLIRAPDNKDWYAALNLPIQMRKRATDSLRRAALLEAGNSTYTSPAWCSYEMRASNGRRIANATSAQHQSCYRQAAAYYIKAADLLDTDFPVVGVDEETSQQREALMTLVYAYLWYAEINDQLSPSCEADVTAVKASMDAMEEAERAYTELRA